MRAVVPVLFIALAVVLLSAGILMFYSGYEFLSQGSGPDVQGDGGKVLVTYTGPSQFGSSRFHMKPVTVYAEGEDHVVSPDSRVYTLSQLDGGAVMIFDTFNGTGDVLVEFQLSYLVDGEEIFRQNRSLDYTGVNFSADENVHVGISAVEVGGTSEDTSSDEGPSGGSDPDVSDDGSDQQNSNDEEDVDPVDEGKPVPRFEVYRRAVD